MTTTLNAFLTGLRQAFGNLRLWLLLYVVNLLVAGLVAYPLFGFMNKRLSTIPLVDQLRVGFDFTVVFDFFNQYGDALGIFQSLTVGGVLLFLLLSVFTTGGVLHHFLQSESADGLHHFWTGGARYYWRIFRLTLYFWLFQSALLVVLLSVLGRIFGGWPEQYDHEGQVLQRVYWVLPVYLFFAAMLMLTQDYAKVKLVATNPTWLFQPIMDAFRWVFRHLPTVLLLALLNLLVFGLLLWLNQQISLAQPLWWAFVGGQLLVFLRVGTKLLNLGSIQKLHQLKSS